MSKFGIYDPMENVHRILQGPVLGSTDPGPIGYGTDSGGWQSQISTGSAPAIGVQTGPRNWTDTLRGWGDSFFGGKDSATGEDKFNKGAAVMGGVKALAGTYLGMKQYNLAKKELAESKRQFDLNFQTQRKDINRRLEDRQNTRNAENSGLHMSTADYMKKYGV